MEETKDEKPKLFRVMNKEEREKFLKKLQPSKYDHHAGKKERKEV